MRGGDIMHKLKKILVGSVVILVLATIIIKPCGGPGGIPIQTMILKSIF